MFELASAALAASIVLSGLALGIGIAFSIKSLSSFGKEELFHCIINSAIIGSFALISTTLFSLGYSCHETSCSIEKTKSLATASITSISEIMFSLGKLSALKVSIGTLSYDPFAGLSQALHPLSSSLSNLSILHSLLSFQILLLKSWLPGITDAILGSGVIFRMFFPLRRAGNFLIGLAAGIIIGFTASAEALSSMALPVLEQGSSDLASISGSLSWIPALHFGDQGVIEDIAGKSADIRAASSSAIISSSTFISSIIFPSLVSLISGTILTILISFGIYKSLSHSLLT